MATSFSSFSQAPLPAPTKFIDFNPLALTQKAKPKPKSKPKPKYNKAATTAAEHDRSKTGPPNDGFAWADIDDFPISDLDATNVLSLEPSALFRATERSALLYQSIIRLVDLII